ncbi:Putative neutral zinc metallopeptidase [Kluyvera cryocrescens]|uniref:Neutral zinc metallopeptidase n=1 Tax=Kluyvera cryocrescens TaxID=580 RepID=A0A485AWI3_KLUCR|nr:Putative neutral zinc metallopeptidase [Kluyvera cryocrescens]
MRWQGRRESDNVEDRRNSSDSQGMGRGPGFRIPSGKGGIILLIVVVVGGLLRRGFNRPDDRRADWSAAVLPARESAKR